MKRIFLSAFSVYGPYLANTTELVAQAIDGKVLAGSDIKTKVLPATIPPDDRGVALFEEALGYGASAIIALGMSSTKMGPCVETVTANLIDSDKYCPGLGKVRIDASQLYAARVPLDMRLWNIPGFVKAAREILVQVETSTDAGGFCYNHLMWQLHHAQLKDRRFASIPWIFLHVPCCREAVPEPVADFSCEGKVIMSVDRVIRSLEVLLANANI